jgi:hypothetical protein
MRTTALSSHRILSVVLGSFVALFVALTPALGQNKDEKDKPKKHDRSNPKPPKPDDLRIALPGSNAASGAATQSAGQQVVVTLRSGTLAGPTGRPISAPSQQLVLGALSGNQTTDRESLVAALTSNYNGQARKQATKLTESLPGLPDHPERLRPAVQAFNAFVNASSAEFLADPPPEFLAVQAALNPMVEAATLASAQQ